MQKARLYQRSADVDELGNLAAASHRLGPHSTARLASTVLGYGHPSQSFRTPSAMSLASIEADGDWTGRLFMPNACADYGLRP